MLHIYLPVLYYHGDIHVTEGAYAGGRGFPLSQRSFLYVLHTALCMQYQYHHYSLKRLLSGLCFVFRSRVCYACV